MRKTPMFALGLVASVGLAGGVAVAQTDSDPGHTLQMSVSPSKAGTKKKPKNTRVKLAIANNKAAGTTASRIVVKFPKNLKFNAKGFDTCSASQIAQDGPDECPKESRLGVGTAEAVVNPKADSDADPNTNSSQLNFKNTFFVGSSKQLNIYLEQTGGDVRKVIPAKIVNGGGKFGKALDISIPGDLQQPAAGVYSALTDIEVSLKGTTGKGRKKHGFFELVGCTGGQLDFQTQLTYVPNPSPPSTSESEAEDTVDCRK